MDRNHIPALDGVRGIAILLVLAVHFIPPVAMQWRISEWFMKIFSTGGWIGVDLFFVLSGFLITGILLKTKDEPGYFVNFYMRRSLRIFPLYFLALAIAFLILPQFIATPRFTALQEHQHYFWLYLSNVGLLTAGREAMDSDVVTPAIYWSLAVEEHFYLVWPSVVFFCRTRSIKTICIAVIASAFVIRCFGALTLGSSSTFFYLSPCRMDGLAAGALVAVILHEQGESGLRSLAPKAAIIASIATTVLASYFLYMKGLWASHWFMRTIGISLLTAIFAAVLIAAVVLPRGTVSAILSWSPLRFFGKYSYGLYVIHALLLPGLIALMPTSVWMAFFGNHVMAGSLSLVFAKIGICLALAIISYHAFEAPFLELKRFFENTSARRLSKRPLVERSARR